MMFSRTVPARMNHGLAWSLLVFLVAPALVAIPVSLTREKYLSLPWSGVSLQYYREIFTSPEWMSSLFQSTVIGLSSAFLATTLGTLAAVGLWRMSSRWSQLVWALLLMPLVIPSIIAAMAFYRLLVPLGLIDTYLGLILAHAVLATPLVLITVSASLVGFDRRLEQASRNLGASPVQTLWRVILPIVRPGVLSGAVFAFITSWDEIVVTLFLTKFSVYTLPRRMWNGIRENTDPAVAAAAVILLAVALSAFLIWTLLQRRSRTFTQNQSNSE